MAHFDIQMSSLSSEFIRSRVSAIEAGVAVDPTSDVVGFAFELLAVTEPASFTTGTWETDSSGPDPVYYARIQIGPGGDIVLANGEYYGWLKITDSPEIPVRRIGRLRIT